MILSYGLIAPTFYGRSLDLQTDPHFIVQLFLNGLHNMTPNPQAPNN